MEFGNEPGNNASLQARLHATDEEWKVVGPMLEALSQAREAINPDSGGQGDTFGFGGRGLPQSSDTFAGPNEVPAGGSLQGGGFGRGGGFGPFGAVVGNIFTGSPPPAEKAATQPAVAMDPTDPASSVNSGTSRQSITLTQALSDLDKAIKDKHTTDKQLGDLLITVRATRAKAEADFKAAEDDLQKVITPEQEAVLVSMGYME